MRKNLCYDDNSNSEIIIEKIASHREKPASGNYVSFTDLRNLIIVLLIVSFLLVSVLSLDSSVTQIFREKYHYQDSILIPIESSKNLLVTIKGTDEIYYSMKVIIVVSNTEKIIQEDTLTIKHYIDYDAEYGPSNKTKSYDLLISGPIFLKITFGTIQTENNVNNQDNFLLEVIVAESITPLPVLFLNQISKVILLMAVIIIGIAFFFSLFAFLCSGKQSFWARVNEFIDAEATTNEFFMKKLNETLNKWRVFSGEGLLSLVIQDIKVKDILCWSSIALMIDSLLIMSFSLVFFTGEFYRSYWTFTLLNFCLIASIFIWMYKIRGIFIIQPVFLDLFVSQDVMFIRFTGNKIFKVSNDPLMKLSLNIHFFYNSEDSSLKNHEHILIRREAAELRLPSGVIYGIILHDLAETLCDLGWKLTLSTTESKSYRKFKKTLRFENGKPEYTSHQEKEIRRFIKTYSPFTDDIQNEFES